MKKETPIPEFVEKMQALAEQINDLCKDKNYERIEWTAGKGFNSVWLDHEKVISHDFEFKNNKNVKRKKQNANLG